MVGGRSFAAAVRARNRRFGLTGALLSHGALAVAFASCLPLSQAAAWGDKTHPVVNRLAIETLPRQAREYFEPRADALARRANEPDTVMRGREGDAEKIRHYIDLDDYMPAPFSGFPRRYHEAVRRYGKERVERNGVLPWVISRFSRQLREAIANGNAQRAVREAAYLGHYVADAYMPLHLTKNHDGQLTGAGGLHKRYEDGLVDARIETNAAEARRLLGRAQPLAEPADTMFAVLVENYALVALILEADRAARERGIAGSPEYYEELGARLEEVTHRQLAAAATMLGSLWLTAWQEATGE